MKRKPALERLPAVETVLRHASLEHALARLPRTLVVEAVREEIAAERARLRNGGGTAASAADLALRAAGRADAARRLVLRRVLNATGVVLHTNLGRAPLPDAAREAVAQVAAGYSSLEYDLEHGHRGERGAGVERWLARLTGAEAAAVVNNGAGAILLALSAVGSGRGVIVSRGELVEIGGSFRVPEVMEKSGARLIEVGATNRTHLRDYERALDRHDDVAAILRVHQSNFRVSGFTSRPPLEDLARLARSHRIPLIEDLGSGALLDMRAFGLEREPTVRDSLGAGCTIVTFSGDKLLGGSQAGLILGRRAWIRKIRKDPLARALRLDKLALAGLEATLAAYADPQRAAREVPVLAMLSASADVLEARARRLGAGLSARLSGVVTKVATATGEVGGGALPLQRLAGPVLEVALRGASAAELERRARAAEPPVIGTIRAGRFRLDPRTLTDAEVEEVVVALASAWGGGRPEKA